MKVEEALKDIFAHNVGPKERWTWNSTTQKYGSQTMEGTMVINNTGYMDSLVGDRKILESNFNSEVLYLDHVGMVGLMGFKMRNGQFAMFTFNAPKSVRTIERVERMKHIEDYKEFKASITNPNQNMDSGEIETWLALKMIAGGRLK